MDYGARDLPERVSHLHLRPPAGDDEGVDMSAFFELEKCFQVVRHERTALEIAYIENNADVVHGASEIELAE